MPSLCLWERGRSANSPLFFPRTETTRQLARAASLLTPGEDQGKVGEPVGQELPAQIVKPSGQNFFDGKTAVKRPALEVKNTANLLVRTQGITFFQVEQMAFCPLPEAFHCILISAKLLSCSRQPSASLISSACVDNQDTLPRIWPYPLPPISSRRDHCLRNLPPLLRP